VSPLARVEHLLLPWTSWVILPVFALANAGVRLDAGALGRVVTSPIAIGVMVGLVVGKPVGIWLGSAIGRRAGTRPSADIGSRATWGVGAAAGVGFTVALFIAELAFPEGPRLDAAKVGVLSGTILAAAVTWAVFHGGTLRHA
jgi:Na+/H+ antiporter NhaA